MTDLERALRAAAALDPAEVARASRAAAEHAVAAGAVDVAWAEVGSPIGPLLAAATDEGLVTLLAGGADRRDEALESLARLVSPRVVEAPVSLGPVRRELDDYFAGGLRAFRMALDWRLVRGSFARRVLAETARIPYGRTRTYAEIAASAGSPRGFRAAGQALGGNPMLIVVPCHRVLRSGGGLGGYAAGLDIKRYLLTLEGAVLAS
jgi:methylated-DNA-[protein]-cysteine S-methyltransferase